jgi:hypothetical protein
MITRFAPAPTGFLHLGHVVNAIYVWGLARVLDGTVLVRVEDHDRIRSRPEFEQALFEDLQWLGFVDASTPFLRQQDRHAAYADALAKADCVALSAVFRKDNDPLKPEEMLSTDKLIADLGARGIPAWTEAGPEEILARLRSELREGDVALCMSNGAFGGLPRKIVANA